MITNAVSSPSLNRQLIEDRTKEEKDESFEFINPSTSTTFNTNVSKRSLLPDNLMSKNPSSEQIRYGLHMALIHLHDIELANQVTLFFLSLSLSGVFISFIS
jgi:hypothetical protein